MQIRRRSGLGGGGFGGGVGGGEFVVEGDFSEAEFFEAVFVLARADDLRVEGFVAERSLSEEVDADVGGEGEVCGGEESETAGGDIVEVGVDGGALDPFVGGVREEVEFGGAFDGEALVGAASEAVGGGFRGCIGAGGIDLSHEVGPGFDHVGVVFGAGFGAEDADGVREGAGGGFEGSEGGHGVEGIDDRTELAHGVHFVAFDAHGVAGAVEAFVVFECDAECDVGEVFDGAEVVSAAGGVGFEGEPVVVVEAFAFVEDFFSDEDFADVVDHSGEADGGELLGVAFTECVGEGDHPGADVDHVGGGVEIVLRGGEEVREGGTIADGEGGDGLGDGFEAWHFGFDVAVGEELVDDFDAGFVDHFGFGADGDFGIVDDAIEVGFELFSELGVVDHGEVDVADAHALEAFAVGFLEAGFVGGVECEGVGCVVFGECSEVDGDILEGAEGGGGEGEGEEAGLSGDFAFGGRA